MLLNYAFLAVKVADVVDNLTMFTKVRGSNPSKVQLSSFSLLSKVTYFFLSLKLLKLPRFWVTAW